MKHLLLSLASVLAFSSCAATKPSDCCAKKDPNCKSSECCTKKDSNCKHHPAAACCDKPGTKHKH